MTKHIVIEASVSILLCKLFGHFRSNRKAPKVAPENFKGSLGVGISKIQEFLWLKINCSVFGLSAQNEVFGLLAPYRLFDLFGILTVRSNELFRLFSVRKNPLVSVKVNII